MTLKQKIAFNGRCLKQAFKIEPLNRTILFFVVFVIATPSFKDFLDYFYNFDPVYDAYIEIIVFVSVLIATIIYSEFLEDTPMKSLIRLSIVALVINSFFNILLVKDMTFGMSKFMYVSLQTLFFDSIYQAFLYLPAFVTLAKVIPEHVEASVFAILKSCQSIQILVYGRIFGSLIYAAGSS